MAEGQIYKIHSDFYYVYDGTQSFECKIREVLKKQKELKRVLTKDELKQVHQETTKDVLDFVDKHLFKIS